MSVDQIVVVSDAHLYHPNGYPTDDLFHDFLQQVPNLGNHLIINGDLFEFWFEYRSVIPRQLFPTLSRLSELRRRGVRLTVTGGNHDRWGGPFWTEQMQARFEPEQYDLDFAGRSIRFMHGDGLGERHLGARVLHWVTRRRLTTALYGMIHPDLGTWGVRKLSRVLGHGSISPEGARRAAAVQEEFAKRYLADRPELAMLVMGHTHRAALVQVSPQQWYLNPGPWVEEARYATVNASGAELHVFDG